MSRLPLFAFLAACGGSVSVPDTDVGDTEVVDTEVAATPIDWRQRGDAFVTQKTETWSVNGCDSAVDRYTPDAPVAADLTVVLTHGFSRSNDQMVELADLLASHGFPVVAPNLCHASFTDTDHPQNGRDLAAIADKTGSARIVYAGFSAGGLASVLAAAQDGQAVGVVGLDPVDADGLGAAAVAQLAGKPLWATFGTPGGCNSDGNGLDWAAKDHRLRVAEAEHCDFEGPTDGWCTGFCSESNPNFSDNDIRGTVRGLTIAAIAAEADVAPIDPWWRPGGVFYDELLAAAAVSVL